ncbi:hypothetical protein MTO96_040937 [Rhipicephalus appendiculatus]
MYTCFSATWAYSSYIACETKQYPGGVLDEDVINSISNSISSPTTTSIYKEDVVDVEMQYQISAHSYHVISGGMVGVVLCKLHETLQNMHTCTFE